MPGSERYFWTSKRDELLRELHAEKISAREIAKQLGTSNTTVSARIKELALGDWRNGKSRKSSTPPEHIERYRDARRGFCVPAHLEDRYHELLKSGISIADTCQQLGIIREAAPGAWDGKGEARREQRGQ